MDLLPLLGIAVALAMDAFAVATATGLRLGRVSRRQTFRLAWHFGLFQALMPVIGWSLGLTVAHLIEAADHWVAFGLLAIVGGKMILEAIRGPDEEIDLPDPTRGLTLIVLSVATSIDALAVGLSLAVLEVAVWWPAVVIGLVAFTFTAVGLHLGRILGSTRALSRWAGFAGGCILILIGIRIVWEHLGR